MKSRKWVVVLTCAALVLSGLSGWLIAGEGEFEDDDREEVAEMLAVFEVLVSGLVTPAAALGSTRDKPDEAYCKNIFKVYDFKSLFDRRSHIAILYYFCSNLKLIFRSKNTLNL